MPFIVESPTPSPPPSRYDQLSRLIEGSYSFENRIAGGTGWIREAYASRPTEVMHIDSITNWRLYCQYIPGSDSGSEQSEHASPAAANGASTASAGSTGERPAKTLDLTESGVRMDLLVLAERQPGSLKVIQGITFKFIELGKSLDSAKHGR